MSRISLDDKDRVQILKHCLKKKHNVRHCLKYLLTDTMDVYPENHINTLWA
jgi:hypothetical protein